ncbi:efflux RND transporter periplasmic adaptor subunit [Colwellia psychrerythraea]|uniref:Efflux transporter, RND family, MFP subunit n=1 Tax=Colwellia psychrerythraea (strain 34H / ATCC BAA-681) TaxID=167879 RepID=Q483S4_COLP3|nr:efflux RND transporter periplasmic adaptor subunit [Colwellia psychrerythraea]AAZ24216.1 efflux transporter, RND family, MFP subunit [Colwellia psychrerythraea 34H]
MNNLMLTNVVPPKMALLRNKSSNKSIKGNLFSSAFITFTFISVIGLLNFCQEANAAETPEKPAHLVSVESVKKEQVNPSIWLPANVISRKNAPISAEQTGQLLWIEDVGSQVKKGQLLAQIDDRHLKLQLAGQQAQVNQHQADVDYLTGQKARFLKLREKNNSALSELERVNKDLTIAINEVAALNISVEQTLLSLEKTTIRAPFTGNISQRFAHVGELISVGRPLVQLIDTKNLDIKIAAPISIAPFLQRGSKVMVKWNQTLIELPVRTWSQAGDQASRTFDVRLAADGIAMLAGTAVTVSLPKQAPREAILVPRDALMLRENETYVLTIDADQQAQKVAVLVGQGVKSWVSVTGALSVNDSVVVRGGERLQSGEKVRFMKDKNHEVIAKVN